MKFIKKIYVILLVCSFTCGSLACGPSDLVSKSFPCDYDVFSINFPLKNDNNGFHQLLKDYIAGHISIIPEKTDLLGLIFVYRYLSNNPPSKENLEYLTNLTIDNKEDAFRLWKEKSQELLGTSPPASFSQIKELRKKIDDYEQIEYFTNCTDNAFTFALKMLNDRKDHYNNDQLKRWIANNNKVFTNCSHNELELPDKLPENASKEELYDYQYQVAAAYFYAMDYDKSSELFKEIAGSDSPHKDLALYLVFRSCFRQIIYQRIDDQVFSKLYKDLENLVNQSSYKIEIDKLYKYFLVKQDITSEIVLLAEKLTSQEITLEDYTDFAYLLNYKVLKGQPINHPFLEWLYSFKYNDNDFLQTYNKWKNDNSLPWLVLALKKIHIDNISLLESKEIIQEAQKINPGEPGYLLIQYYLAKLALSEKNYVQLKDLTEKVLTTVKLAPYELNLFRYLRSYTAVNYQEYLDHVIQPIIYIYDKSFNDYYVAKESSSDIVEESWNNIQNIPTKMLVEAVKYDIPKWLKKRIIAAAWTRYVLLDQITQEVNISATLVQLNPELNDILSKFLAEKDPKLQQKLAHFIVMNSPGLSIFVDGYMWRNESMYTESYDMLQLTQLITYGHRHNWWDDSTLQEFNVDNQAEFLKINEKKQAQEEWGFLKEKLRDKTDYFCLSSIEAFNTFKKASFVPEMLHLCVRMSTVGWAPYNSYKAFTILHKYFKDNEFTLKTPYHYYKKS